MLDQSLIAVGDQCRQLLGGVVGELDAALGAAHGHSALDCGDDEYECRELCRLSRLGAVLTQ
ncbi:hypothetical protein [Streptomyces sp. NPDC006668]|uniref:hypothetical protein n=1 Tax=Streptomyces sp. NPDC006668 TaxID=3156903 RepID=UPI0034096922